MMDSFQSNFYGSSLTQHVPKRSPFGGGESGELQVENSALIAGIVVRRANACVVGVDGVVGDVETGACAQLQRHIAIRSTPY